MSLVLNMIGGGGSFITTDAILRVQAPATSVVTITKGSTVKTDYGHENMLDPTVYDYYFIIHQSQFDSINPWVVTATNNGASISKTIIINASDEYDIAFSFEFGVSWDKSASTVLTRLGESSNFSNPIPAVGTGVGSSPFDTIMPWSGMTEFNIINNVLSYERGVDSEFSRTAYDTVVRIPKFYYKVINGTNWELWISPVPLNGYSLHPAFYESDSIYVGKYHTVTGIFSKSGITPITATTLDSFRTSGRNKGPNWDIYNISIQSAIQMLYLVEFADWNSQSVIGKGLTNGNIHVTGGTDSVEYHTGRPSGTNDKVQVKYRNIEDLWGNVWQGTDGFLSYYKSSTRHEYYCLDREKFSSTSYSQYTRVSFNFPETGYIKTIGFDSNAPWLILPATVGGSESTYIPDKISWGAVTGTLTSILGGAATHEGAAGLFCIYPGIASSATFEDVGSRLIWFPI